MYVDKILLTIFLCATNVWCSDRTLVRNARTFDSSSFAWLQSLFSNHLDISIIPKLWPSRQQLREWTRNGIANLLHLAFVTTGEEPMHIEFRPEDGPRAAKGYQRRFGYRGEWLIKQLGNGLDPDIRLNRKPVPRTFSMLPFRSTNLIRNSAYTFKYNR